MKVSLIQPERKENGFKVFNKNSNEEFVEMFSTNGVKSIKSELKIWINSNLSFEFTKIHSQPHKWNTNISFIHENYFLSCTCLLKQLL